MTKMPLVNISQINRFEFTCKIIRENGEQNYTIALMPDCLIHLFLNNIYSFIFNILFIHKYFFCDLVLIIILRKYWLWSGSMKDYSGKGSFGSAFHQAHSQLGPGSKFTYNGNAFTTNCADGGNYRTKPIQHTYTKDTFLSTRGQFSTNGNNYDARSGAHIFSSIKYGEIPNGDYKVSSVSNTGGIKRFNLEPEKDIGSRTSLQIHQQNPNTKWDTKGCISVDSAALANIKIGDKLHVKK